MTDVQYLFNFRNSVRMREITGKFTMNKWNIFITSSFSSNSILYFDITMNTLCTYMLLTALISIFGHTHHDRGDTLLVIINIHSHSNFTSIDI